MQVKDLMTKNPATARPDMGLQEVARMMVDFDCGAIPVVKDDKPIGIITDRDITCRTVAEGVNPLDKTVDDVMTHQVFTVTPDTNAHDCLLLMEAKQVRRVVVVDGNDNRVLGIVAQADVARHAPARNAAELVRDISQPAA